MEPRFPGLPKGTPETGKALGIPGTANVLVDTERKPGIGRPTNCFTGIPTNCKLLAPRRAEVAGLY
jgi:hypothetical protein